MPEDQKPSPSTDTPVVEMPATEEVSSDNGSVFDEMSDDITREKEAESTEESEGEATAPSGEVTDQTQEAPAAAEKPEIDWKKEHAKLQTRHQKYLDSVKSVVPIPTFNAIKAVVDTPAEAGTPSPIAEGQPASESLYDMTPVALQNMVNNAVVDSHNRIQAAHHEQAVAAQFKEEQTSANEGFYQFTHDEEGKEVYTQDEIKTAYDNVQNRYGLDHEKPGMYSLMTGLVVDQLQLITMRKHLAGEVTSKQIDAIDKARDIALTKQPPGAATPSAKTKTANDEALAFIKSAAPKAKLSDLHGT